MRLRKLKLGQIDRGSQPKANVYLYVTVRKKELRRKPLWQAISISSCSFLEIILLPVQN